MMLRHTLAEERHEPVAGGVGSGGTGGGLTRIVERNMAMRRFLLRMLDPEDLGHAVSREVRDSVRQLLGMTP